MTIREEDEVARCRRIRDAWDNQFKSLDEAFAALQAYKPCRTSKGKARTKSLSRKAGIAGSSTTEVDEVERCRKVREELNQEYGSVENAFRAMRVRSRARLKSGSATPLKKSPKGKAAPRSRAKIHN